MKSLLILAFEAFAVFGLIEKNIIRYKVISVKDK